MKQVAVLNPDFGHATFVIRVSCLAWLAAKMISWKLWMPFRLFPMIPVFDFLPELPDFFHLILFLLFFTGIILLLIFPHKKQLALAVIIFEMLSCVFDQMRWQPWEYQYLLTLIIYFYYRNKEHQFGKLLAFLIGSTYIFSGVHKLNPSFLDNIWNQMVLRDFLKLSSETIANDIVHYSGILLGMTEFLIGFGLLFINNKRIFIISAIVMHLLLLVVLGPFGVNFNEVVWPWNMAMPVLVWIVFSKNQIRFNTAFFKPVFNLMMGFIIGLLPILNFFGLWDDYLSFNLYSGKNERVFVCTELAERHSDLSRYELQYLTMRIAVKTALQSV